MKLPIYMDYNATTPTDPRVLDAMYPFYTEKFGNPASRQHQYGWIAEEAVESSRQIIARSIGAEGKEIVFTSGATEANNIALKGIAESWKHKGSHIITVATEHKSVLDTCKYLEKHGYRVSYMITDDFGLIDLNRLRDAINPGTILVSVMTANNETGLIQNVAEIGEICREKEVFFHTDAVQALGKIQINIKSMNIDLISLSGHKIYGPKGIGVLYLKSSNPKVKVAAQMHGGGQERGIRSGTLNVPAIVGMAKAIEIAVNSMEFEADRLRHLRDKMWKAFSTQLDDVYLNGHPTQRLPDNLNVSFLHVDDNALIMSMKDIAVSTGSACGTSDQEPSHVLKALGLPVSRLNSAIRFGLGRFTTEEEVDYVIGKVIDNVRELRELSPVYKKYRKVE